MFAKALLLGALAACAAAQSKVLLFTRVPNPVTDGEPQAITYSTNDTETPVTIILRKGSSTNLQTVETLTTNANGGQYIWTPHASLPNGADYALEIKQNNQVNYFGPLTIQGAVPASVSAYASAASANSTMTSTGTGASTGTGTAMHRNTTMIHPHKNTTNTNTNTNTHTTKTNTKKMTAKPTKTTTHGTGGGASFQATSATGGKSSPTSTGGASIEYSASSSFALVFGALAAILYLH